MNEKTFGQTIKEKRLKMNITLRKFAEKVKLSPAFISKIENNEFKPPKEENIIKIAEELNLDKDELLAKANKISNDIKDIIIKNPKQFASFLRTIKDNNNNNDEFWNKINHLTNDKNGN